MTNSETARWLGEHDGYLILTHRRPDGDTHGCAAALARGLRNAGKTAYILENPETTERYLEYVEPLWAPEGFAPATVVSVDTASEGMLQQNAGMYCGKIDLSIDHHPSNTGYAGESCLDGTAAACGEVIYEILMELCGSIDTDIAAAIYVAVSTDTGCFSFGNTTGNTFRVASLATAAGAPIGIINRRLFRMKKRSRFELEGIVMSTAEFLYGGQVAIITVTRDTMERTGCTENDMDDIAAIPGSVEGVHCGITIRELATPGECKISVRTNRLVNANELCVKFGGGGHAMAAGATFSMGAGEVRDILVRELDKIFPLEQTWT